MKNLYETTMQKIRESGMSASKLSKEAKVGKRWLHDLIAGRFKDPGVNKIQRLHDYLNSKK